jgi:PAS domain S-box-containing protein
MSRSNRQTAGAAPRPRTPPRDAFAINLVRWAGLLVALTWALLGADLWWQHQRRLDNAQAQATVVARAMSERVLRTIRVVDQSLLAIMQEFRGHIGAHDVDAITTNLRRHVPRLDDILTIAFDDNTGLCIAQANPLVPTGVNYADSEFFRAHLADANLGLYVEQPVLGLATARKLFTLSRRVVDNDGHFLGVLVAPISADALATEFDAVRSGPRGTVALVHVPSYRMIARQPNYATTFAKPLVQTHLLDALAHAPSGFFAATSPLDKERRDFTYVKLDDLPLVVVVGVSQSDIRLQLLHDLAGYILLAIALTAIVAAGARALLAAHRRELALRGELAEKEATISAFFAASPLGMAMLDTDLRYRQVNRALADMNGVARADTIGKTIHDVVPQLAARLEPALRQVVDSGQPCEDVEITGETASQPGTPRCWLLSFFPIADPRGGVTGIGCVVMEITERKQAEASLARWRQIFEHGDWGVAVGSADGQTLELVNPAFARMHGRSVAELTGQPIASVFAPEALAALPADIALTHERGHRRYESAHRHADGHSFPVLIDATTVRDDAGQVLYRIVNVQDITETRRTQEEMRIAKEFFQNLFDAAPLGKAIANLDGRYIRVNRAMCDFLGYSEQELLALTFQDITHPDDLDTNVDFRQRMLAGGPDVFRMEKRYLHKDGRALWAVLVASVVRDAAGKPAYTIGQMMDIDLRKRAEEALNRKDMELREALRVGRIGSWNLDLAEGIATWSAELCRIVGRDPAHPTLDSAARRRYYTAASLAAHEAAIERATSVGEAYELELEIVRGNGQHGWLLVCGEAVREAGGGIVRLRGTAQDITERKQTELALRQTREQLRALSAYQETMLEEERKRIAREVHDELGQFLTALKMDISLIRLRFGEDAELREKVEDMRGLVEKTIQVVRHVASNLRPAALDLGLVAAIEWLAEDFGHRWEIDCRVELAGSDIVLDDVRSTAVFRLVQESLTNVARHAAADKVIISLDRRGARLHVRVWDNGRGFDPAAVRKLRGFGLLGMRERALSLGGTLHIKSSVGNGTTVVFNLPMAHETT